MADRRRLRPAFTLIELLLVIAIIAVLIGLLLPAVQKVREAANRLKCTSNLKNLGLALHQFENTHGKFPPSQITGGLPEAGVTVAVNHGWGVFMLPYIEQQALAEKYFWNLRFSDPKNQPVATAQLKVVQCPSVEPDRFMTSEVWAPYGGKAACTDYGPTAYVHATLLDLGLVDRVGNAQGVMSQNFMTRLRDITDGTSHTILLAEDAGRPKEWRLGRPGRDQAIIGGPWAGYGNQLFVAGSPPDGSSTPGPCAINCNNDRQIYSFHPGGANIVLADGSVRFLKAGLDIRILARLVTRAGGEVVSASDY